MRLSEGLLALEYLSARADVELVWPIVPRFFAGSDLQTIQN